MILRACSLFCTIASAETSKSQEPGTPLGSLVGGSPDIWVDFYWIRSLEHPGLKAGTLIWDVDALNSGLIHCATHSFIFSWYYTEWHLYQDIQLSYHPFTIMLQKFWTSQMLSLNWKDSSIIDSLLCRLWDLDCFPDILNTQSKLFFIVCHQPLDDIAVCYKSVSIFSSSAVCISK